MADFPLKDPTVEDFKNWWLAEGAPIRPPFLDAIFFTEMTNSLCLYRHGIFQVELYIVKKNTESPIHYHPGVDSCFLYLTGNLEFGDEQGHYKDLQDAQQMRPDGSHFLLGKTVTIGSSKHSVRCGKEGGSYLSFEKWNCGFPSTVARNWKGTTVGKFHDQLINNSGIEELEKIGFC